VPVDDEVLQRLVAGVYVEPRLRVGGTQVGSFDWAGILVQPGLRVQADSASDSLGIDPRLTVRAPLGDAFGLRMAAGRYSQAPPLDVLSPTAGDPELGMATADQASLGADLVVAERLEVGLEGWGKQVHGAIVQPATETPYSADGTAWGVELTSRYRMREVVFAWASVAVGRSMRDGVPFDYDQPFAANLVGSWNPNEKWNLGLRYRYAIGLPYTPITEGLYVGTDDTWVPVEGDPNSARLPNVQKLDVHAQRTFRVRRLELEAYAEGWFVPPANNGMYVVYSYDYSQAQVVGGPVFVPIVGLRGEI
jgi:hypothetical protein